MTTSSSTATATAFEKLGLYTAVDFCLHLPTRYEDQYHAYPAAHAAQKTGKCVLYVQVVATHHTAKRMRWEVRDAFDDVQRQYHPPHEKWAEIVFESQIPRFEKLPIYIDFFAGGRTLNIGQSYFVYGELKYMGQYLQMSHPFILSYRRDSDMVPIYPSCSGLTQYKIAQTISSFIQEEVAEFSVKNQMMAHGLFKGILLISLFQRLGIENHYTAEQLTPEYFIGLAKTKNLSELLNIQIDHHTLLRLITSCGFYVIEALTFLHELPSYLSEFEYQMIAEKTHPAYDLLKVYEYLAYQISLLQAHQLKVQHQLPPLLSFEQDIALQKINDFINGLPWPLTEGQQHVWAEILTDLAKPVPMQRLLQGDVGSGKTVIALLSALYMAAQHQQVVIMAPTEILAQQLAKKCQEFLSAFNFKIELLVGSTRAKQKQSIKERLLAGDIDIIVGTHALIQDDVQFKKLGLIVIDEQHRFGVRQRLKLKQKYIAHELMMSATPIPRTLAMGLYAYLNLSTIHGLPANRQGIQTKVLSTEQRPALIKRLQNLLADKAQIYWVCPLIEEKSEEKNEEKSQKNEKEDEGRPHIISEKKTLQNAQATYNLLKETLPEAKIELLHGKIKAAEKNQIMNRFAAAEVDILVATTVIEVGVDVPNANVMIIEDATQFGLAQLHQLRGRVGRGSRASYCLLLYQQPIGATARERLKVMQDTQDGFIIAQKDLELRGFGELLGQKQAGEIGFRLFDFIRDGLYVENIKRLAQDILAQNVPIDDFIEFWLSKDIEIIKQVVVLGFL